MLAQYPFHTEDNTLWTPYLFDIYTPRLVTCNVSACQVQHRIGDYRLIVLGDLHGSYLKLFETLLVTGLVTVPSDAFKSFLCLAQQLDILLQSQFWEEKAWIKTQNVILQLSTIIQEIQWCGGQKQLLLLGDVLADRGALDLLTLLIWEQVTLQAPQAMIGLASNHDHAVLDFLMTRQLTFSYGQQRSLINTFLLNGLESRIENLYRQYLSQIQLWHYSKENQVLFTHAPIHTPILVDLLSDLQQLGYWNPKMRWSTLKESHLELFVKAANAFYSDHVLTCLERDNSNAYKTLGRVMRNFLWARNRYTLEEELPLLGKGVTLLVHGHDSQSKTSPYSFLTTTPGSRYRIVNLDQTTRKGLSSSTESNSLLFIM